MYASNCHTTMSQQLIFIGRRYSGIVKEKITPRFVVPRDFVATRSPSDPVLIQLLYYKSLAKNLGLV